jgi:Enoyl-(Acyl carrier protein) reductase
MAESRWSPAAPGGIGLETTKAFLGNGAKVVIVDIDVENGNAISKPQAAYNASKAAVIMLTKSLAGEWADRGVRVNCISPGYVNTPMTQGGMANKEWYDRWMQFTPLRRVGEPQDIAPAVLFLASDSSSFFTGSDPSSMAATAVGDLATCYGSVKTSLRMEKSIEDPAFLPFIGNIGSESVVELRDTLKYHGGGLILAQKSGNLTHFCNPPVSFWVHVGYSCLKSREQLRQTLTQLLIQPCRNTGTASSQEHRTTDCHNAFVDPRVRHLQSRSSSDRAIDLPQIKAECTEYGGTIAPITAHVKPGTFLPGLRRSAYDGAVDNIAPRFCEGPSDLHFGFGAQSIAIDINGLVPAFAEAFY